MPGNVKNRPSGSSMVDMWISSNIMKPSFPKCYMTFWDINHIQWHPPSIKHFTKSWPCAEPDCITSTVFGVITLFRKVSIGHLQRVRQAAEDTYWSGRLAVSYLGLAFVLTLSPCFPELVMFTDRVRFEHPLVLLFSSEIPFYENSFGNLYFP